MPFNEIVGHTSQIQIIKELLEKETFPNSAVFAGPKGIGKKLIAKTTAKLLSNNEFGVKILGEEKTVSIEEVRDSISWLMKKPSHSKSKVAIIDGAEKMRIEASNALLKILEEPPAYGFLFLIATNENYLLPTIRSRCKVFRFGKLSKPQVETVLKNLGIKYDEKIMKLSGNSPGRAIALSTSKVPELIETLGKIIKEKKVKEKTLEFSSLFSSLSIEETELFLESLLILTAEKGNLEKWFEPIEKARNFLKSYGRPKSVIEWLLVEITGGWRT